VATLIPSDLFRLSGYLYVRPPPDDKARKPAADGLAGSDASRTTNGRLRMNLLESEPPTPHRPKAPHLDAAFMAQLGRLAVLPFGTSLHHL